jgi:hypothetical protein
MLMTVPLWGGTVLSIIPASSSKRQIMEKDRLPFIRLQKSLGPISPSQHFALSGLSFSLDQNHSALHYGFDFAP